MITRVKQTVVVNCSLLHAFQPRRILILLSYLRQEKSTFYTQALHIFIQSCSCCMPLTRYSFGGLATGKITFIIISSSLIICCLKDASKKISTKKVHAQPNVTNIDLSSSNVIDSSNNISSNNTNSRRVFTRSAFTRTLQERYSNRVSGMHPTVTSSNTTNNFSSGEVTAMVQGITNHRREFRTVFDVRGLSRLDDAFRVMDDSVACKNNASLASSLAENILDPKEVRAKKK